MKALQAAALQQQLMVAALTCHDTADYNLFVTTYRSELLESDRALKDFFLRRDPHEGEDGYNAYKTRLANVLSLRSLHDPQFCRSSKVAFDVALKRKGAQTELASERPSLIETGYKSCVPGGSEKTQMVNATPNLPSRHQMLSSSPPPMAMVVPKLAPRPDRALPSNSQQRYAMDALKLSSDHVQAGKLPASSSTQKTFKIAEATPSLSLQRGALPDRLPSAIIVASALPLALPQHKIMPPARPTTGRMQMRDVTRHEAYNRIANGRGDLGRYGSGARRATDLDEGSPDYNPDYPGATQRQVFNEGQADYDDVAGDNTGDLEVADDGFTANHAPGASHDSYNAPSPYVPYAYRPHGYWIHSYGPPMRPRLVRGPDGGWYLLPPYGP